MNMEPCCSCCGTPTRLYQEEGHNKECIWYEDEMYRLAKEWLNSNGNTSDWLKRYKLVVNFLLEQINVFRKQDECFRECFNKMRSFYESP